ncbi:FIST C-terminal domain-containing protein [Paraglaciecola sp. 20A4]|uniref:FIST signal transduction protein n=1 Tax=Paraglaciecola sp. 20A4 TaxID=2687288 RepID=UPI00140E88FD|nr:FIST C-terminal domain-containing protein [Paraglaciecola sp. 20A4]
MAVFTHVQFNSDVTVQALANSVNEVMSSNPKGLMILSTGEAANWGTEFDNWLEDLRIPIFGAIVPGLILDSTFEPTGILVAGMANSINVSVIENISTESPQNPNIELTSSNVKSVIVMVDALSRQVDAYLQQILRSLPDDCCVFGGGAGTLAFVPQPCLFSSAGMHQDAMLLVEMSTEWDLAVGHGWEILAGPYLANNTDDNCILELNFEPAVTLYQRVVEEHTALRFDKHDFFDIAKTFPFGLARLDDSVLIRDPIKVEGQGLICAGDIPDNTMLYIMQGDAEKLISAASGAVRSTISNLATSGSVSDCILFDCVSRQLFLQDEFSIELNQIHAELSKPYRTVGALVLGEIALDENGILSLHNKTAVTALARAQSE